jgi:NAD(P)-dependent dehydrogenase (short-subunit alcohol dehydrogenase family)
VSTPTSPGPGIDVESALPDPLRAAPTASGSSRVAVVSGASAGIGRAVAQRLARDGARVVGIDMASQDETAASIRATGGRFGQVSLDVRDRAAIDAALAELDRIDVVVPCAGIATIGGAVSKPADWERVLRVNLDGAYALVAGAWPAMERARSGAIVLVSSMAAHRGSLVVAPEYSASKGALESLNRHFARAGGPVGIRCNCVAPGVIDTEMTRRFPPPRVADIPLGRVGLPEEVASVVAFLAGAEAAYVTGASVPIAGGLFFC